MQNANCKLQIANCCGATPVGACAHSLRLDSGSRLWALDSRLSGVKSQEWRVKSRKRGNALRSGSGPPPSTLDPPPFRRGITLVELLITILIISILAGLILGVAAVAAETAREAHTRNMVTRLHTLLMEHNDSYKTRRVRLHSNAETAINTQFANNPSVRGRALAEARLYALREMMLMEIPDRWSDVLLRDVRTSTSPSAPPVNPNTALTPLYLVDRTNLSNVFLRRYAHLVDRTNALTGAPNTAEEIQRNQGAECLYMIITIACGDGEARTLFHESDIGDSDGDGAPEFLDGWERPINFLRWAPGFDSQIQLNLNVLQSMSANDANAAVAEDHDPFDVFRAELIAFRLVPLIYSPGPDEASGLNVATEHVTWRWSASSSITVRNTPPFLTPNLTPYAKGSPNWPDEFLGTPIDTTSTDNIHNHLLGLR